MTPEERAVIARAIRWNETHDVKDESEAALSKAVEALVATGDPLMWQRILESYER